MRFWPYSNSFGTITNSNDFQLNASVFSNFYEETNGFYFSYHAAFNGYLATKNKLLMMSLILAYAIISYNWIWVLNRVKNSGIVLSSTNRSISISNNVRSFPGYNFRLVFFVSIPGHHNKFFIKASYGDYIINDQRVVDNACLHVKCLVFKTVISKHFNILTGLYHYAQWGGTSQTFGKQPSGFKNYPKIITSTSAETPPPRRSN